MKTLIVYYSHSGNTRRLAENIAHATGGDLLELVPETPYPRDYNTVVAQAKQEIRNGFRPALKNVLPSLSQYDAVLVGTPNWWSSIAPPLASFLEKCDLTGKRVAPFCTHGGGGSGHIRHDVEKQCRGSVLPELSVYGNTGTPADVRGWLESIGFSQSN